MLGRSTVHSIVGRFKMTAPAVSSARVRGIISDSLASLLVACCCLPSAEQSFAEPFCPAKEAALPCSARAHQGIGNSFDNARVKFPSAAASKEPLPFAQENYKPKVK